MASSDLMSETAGHFDGKTICPFPKELPVHIMHDATLPGWASKVEPEFVIGSLRYRGRIPLLVQINPTDSRGCRCIVKLFDPEDPTKFMNPEEGFGLEPRLAINQGLTLVQYVFVRLCGEGQTAVAGNNAHSKDNSKNLVLGKDGEPYMLHGHAWAVQDPDYKPFSSTNIQELLLHFCKGDTDLQKAVTNFTIGCAEPGTQMNLRTPKRKWASTDIVGVLVKFMRYAIACAIKEGNETNCWNKDTWKFSMI